jgi:hypothetical protein
MGREIQKAKGSIKQGERSRCQDRIRVNTSTFKGKTLSWVCTTIKTPSRLFAHDKTK